MAFDCKKLFVYFNVSSLILIVGGAGNIGRTSEGDYGINDSWGKTNAFSNVVEHVIQMDWIERNLWVNL